MLDSTEVSSLDLVDFCPVLDVGQIDLSQVGTAQIRLVDPIACDPLAPEFPMTFTLHHRNYLLEKPSIGPVD